MSRVPRRPTVFQPPPVPTVPSASRSGPPPRPAAIAPPPAPPALARPHPPQPSSTALQPPPSMHMQWAGVQLPASLPQLTFMSAEIWHPERVGAMAIYCSDGRWGDAFDEFCHRSLNIPRYDRFAVPGGPGWLTARAAAEPAVRQAARAQLEYLVKTHDLDRLVLITHFGCGFYHEKLKVAPEAAMPAQLEDLRSAGKVLREWFDGIAVEEYLAMRAGNCLSFHRVEG